MTTTPIRPPAVSLLGLDDAALLEVIGSALDRLGSQPLAGAVDDERLHARVRALGRCEARLAAEKLRSINEVATRESFRADAERSAADWVAAQLGVDAHEARRQVRVAAAMRRLPCVGQRLAAGDVTLGHAVTATRGLAVLDRHAKAAAFEAGDDIAAHDAAVADADAAVTALDAFVAGQPGDVDPAALGNRIEAWTITHRPAAEALRQRRALQDRELRWLGQRDENGCHTGIIKTNDTGRAQIDAALAPLATKTSADDDRTVGQRRHDALVTLAQQACDRGDLPTIAGQRPHISVVTNPAAQAGDPDAEPAWLDGIGHIGTATAQLLACDAETTDIVYDRDRRVWIIGRSNGDPSPAQRRIVHARDRACVGCGAPASRSKIHHIRYRSNGGATVVDNLVLVCWSCHHGLHHLGWTITTTADGSFTISKTKRRAG